MWKEEQKLKEKRQWNKRNGIEDDDNKTEKTKTEQINKINKINQN